MTAIDKATQARRLGAEDVTMVYRRGPDRMGASQYERDLAQTDGVKIKYNAQPTRLIENSGHVVAVEFEYTAERDGPPRRHGRDIRHRRRHGSSGRRARHSRQKRSPTPPRPSR